MKDQKLGHWFGVGMSSKLPLPNELKTPAIVPPVTAFRKNAIQALRLAAFPIDMVKLGQQMKLAQIAARVVKFGDPCFNRKLFASEETEVWNIFDGIMKGT